MKYLFAVASLFAVSVPVQAETIYLIIKSAQFGTGIALQSIPMTSMEQCEEAGTLLISSKRFDVTNITKDGFECVEGK